MVRNLKELVELISRRDGISRNEAWYIVDEVQEELEEAFARGSLTMAEDILAEGLGLEPDYLDLFM